VAVLPLSLTSRLPERFCQEPPFAEAMIGFF